MILTNNSTTNTVKIDCATNFEKELISNVVLDLGTLSRDTLDMIYKSLYGFSYTDIDEDAMEDMIEIVFEFALTDIMEKNVIELTYEQYLIYVTALEVMRNCWVDMIGTSYLEDEVFTKEYRNINAELIGQPISYEEFTSWIEKVHAEMEVDA